MNDLTATAGSLNLSVGLWFWLAAIAIGYFTDLFRSFRGKVDLSESHGH